MAFSRGWMDAAMAVQMLHGVESTRAAGHLIALHARVMAGRRCITQPHPKDYEYHSAKGMMEEMIPLLHDTSRVLRRLADPLEPPPTRQFRALTKRIESVLRCYGSKSCQTCDIPVLLHTLWEGVGTANVSRWTLWPECVRTLQWFRSPFAPEARRGRAHNEGAKQKGEEEKRKGKRSNDDGRDMDEGHDGDGPFLEATPETIRVLRAFMRCCDGPESEFITSVAADWLCANGRTPLPPLSHALSMSSWSSLVEAEAEASSRPLLLYVSACDLLLDAVVWAGRHRRKGLLRRLLPLMNGIPTHRALHAYTVAAQCLTSGPHAEVLMDWPIVCIAIGRMTTTAAEAERKDDGALADSTAAVLDKLRRTFHFLIRKIALDAHRQRHTAVPAVSLSTTTTTTTTTTAHTDMSTTSLSLAASSSLPCTFSSTVELRAAAYMDLCEEFSRCLSAREWARVCVEKALECIWDVNYALYVWYSAFCTNQTPSTAAAVRVVQGRYRRLMGTHIALLPASQLFAPARVERWLAVMSGGDANAAALVNDATALDAAPGTPAVFVVLKTINALTWRRVALDEAYAERQQRRVLHEKPTEEKNNSDTNGKEEVWRDAPVNRYAVEQRRHEKRTVNAQGMDIEKHPLPPLSNGALPTSLFDDPAALLSWRHIHLMQRAGGALFLAALCEGRAGDCAISVQWVMSWLHCPRHVLRTVSNILPRETLRAAWADAPAVFLALARQSALCGVVANEKKEEEKEEEEEESQAAALLRLLLTSPAVQSIARVDAATAAAALLALRESDFKMKKVHTVTETAAASPVWMVCRLLAAFPRMLDTALLPRLVRGELCATQRRAIDTMVQCVCDAQSAAGPMHSGGGGAPLRVAHAWRVVRCGVHEPCKDSSHNDWGVGLDVDAAVRSAQHVFAKVMIGNEEEEKKKEKKKKKEKEGGPETRTAVRGQRNVLMSAVDWETARRALEAAQRLLNESPCSSLSHSHSHSYSLVEPFLMALECYGPHISVKWRNAFAATECARRQQQKQENKQEEQKQKEEEQCWTLCEAAHRLAWAPVSWQLLLCAPEQRENVCAELRRAAAAATNSSSDKWADILAALLHRRCRRCCHAWPLLPTDAPNGFCAAAAVAAESAAVLERLAVCAMQGAADGAVAAAALLLLSCSSSSSSVSMSVPRDHLHLLPAVVFRLYCRCGLRGCLTEPVTGTEAETIIGQKDFSAAGDAACAPRPLLWRRFVDCASRLLRTAPLRNSAATECVSALALCLSADAACSNDPVMFADALRPIVDMAGDCVAVESDGAARRAAGLFVQSAMLAALWRPIYWFAMRLLPSHGQEGHMQHEAVTWPIALVPAVIMAAAMRTTSALQEETRTLLSRVQYCAELSPFELDTLRNELLGSAASAGPLSRGTSFLARAAMVRPVLRAARLLLRPGRGVDFFFYLSDAQWKLLQRCLGAFPSSFANLPNEHRVLSSSSSPHSYSYSYSSSSSSSGVPVSVSLSSGCGTASALPSWEAAVSTLCALPRESFHAMPTPNTCVTSSLRVFRSACLSGTMSWALVRELFLSGHLPHSPHVFPALVSERVVNACASPAEARYLLRHSLNTVPSPTRVQQCIAYLILRRHRTDTAWAAQPMHTAPALFSTQDAGLLKDGIADSIGGKGLSWEMACWCRASVTGHGAPRLPQRHMSEVLRHCALDPTAAVKMYEAYWCAGYARVEGAHPFLTLLRAAGREAGSEALALRAMRDYVRCDDETVSAGFGPALTADGHAATVRAFARLCANGIVSAAAAAEVAEALRSRGRLGDVEELLLLVHRQTGNGKGGTQERREREK